MDSRSSEDEIPPQDWRLLEVGAAIAVVDPRGFSYAAWVDEKTHDSHIVWVRRWDLGSRHLLERHDGFRIVPLPETVPFRPPSAGGRR